MEKGRRREAPIDGHAPIRSFGSKCLLGNLGNCDRDTPTD